MTASGHSAQILDALVTRVSTLVVGAPTLPIAYPQDGFDPGSSAPDGKYLSVNVLFNRPAWESLAAGRVDQGLLEIAVVWPSGQGLGAPTEVASEIIDHFPLGAVMISGQAKVKVSRQPWVASPIVEEGVLRLPVTIPWTA